MLITEREKGEMYCRRKMPPEKKTEKKDEEKEKSSVPWVRQLFPLNALSSFGVRRNISHNLRPTMCDHNCVESK